jgi:hypothetical protein
MDPETKETAQPMEEDGSNQGDDDDQDYAEEEETIQAPLPPMRFTMAELGTFDPTVALPSAAAYDGLLAHDAWRRCRMGVIRFDNVQHLKRAMDILRSYMAQPFAVHIPLHTHVQPNTETHGAYAWSQADIRVARTDGILDDNWQYFSYADDGNNSIGVRDPPSRHNIAGFNVWLELEYRNDPNLNYEREQLTLLENGDVANEDGDTTYDLRWKAYTYEDRKTGSVFMPNVLMSPDEYNIPRCVILYTDIIKAMYKYARTDMFTFLLGGTARNKQSSVHRFVNNGALFDRNLLGLIAKF